MRFQERSPRRVAPSPAPRPDGPDAQRLLGWVQRLAVPRHRRANARGNARVREEVAAALRDCGLEVQLQGRYRNVVALPPAARGPLVAVAAHYDGVPDCPGADDNASGLAVLLECARCLAAAGRAAQVAFLAFNAEEDQLLGSRDFVAHGLKSLAAPLGVVHVLEMVGFRTDGPPVLPLPLPGAPAGLEVPDYLGLLATGASNPVAARAVASTAAPGLRVVALETDGPLHTWFPDFARSDHFPFWSAELPALLWTDTGNFRNPHYHRETDTPDTLDPRFMREVAELLCAVVAGEATGERA